MRTLKLGVLALLIFIGMATLSARADGLGMVWAFVVLGILACYAHSAFKHRGLAKQNVVLNEKLQNTAERLHVFRPLVQMAATLLLVDKATDMYRTDVPKEWLDSLINRLVMLQDEIAERVLEASQFPYILVLPKISPLKDEVGYLEEKMVNMVIDVLGARAGLKNPAATYDDDESISESLFRRALHQRNLAFLTGDQHEQHTYLYKCAVDANVSPPKTVTIQALRLIHPDAMVPSVMVDG